MYKTLFVITWLVNYKQFCIYAGFILINLLLYLKRKRDSFPKNYKVVVVDVCSEESQNTGSEVCCV